jgi:predicted NUDIX family phosphoesterase
MIPARIVALGGWSWMMKSSMTFLDAAWHVLHKANRPLTVAEILHASKAEGLLQTEGKTPAKSMNARLAVDILKNKARSRFMRADGSRFALREWQTNLQERIVPRRTVALVEEDILAFDADILSKFVNDTALKRGDENHQELLASCFPVKRSEAERRYDIIQLVSVYVVRHYQQYLTHRRSARLPEQRLHGAYSCFFGGHLTPLDLMPLFRFSDPEQALYLLDRELTEEVRLPSRPSMNYCGLLYDPRSDVSRQHMGIVFCVDVKEEKFEIGEKGFLTDAKFETLADMRARISEFENWSEYLITKELAGWN